MVKATVKSSGKSVTVQFPQHWGEVTFEQLIDISKCKTEAEQIAYFSKIPFDQVRKAHVTNLPKIESILRFLQTDIPDNIPDNILGFEVPKNINFEAVGKFEDIKTISSGIDSNNPDDLIKYTELITIYLMPDYLDAKPEQQAEFAKQFLKAPCSEVLALGNFILRRYIESLKTSKSSFPVPVTQWNKFRLAMKGLRVTLVSSIRLYIWKRRQALKDQSLPSGQ